MDDEAATPGDDDPESVALKVLLPGRALDDFEPDVAHLLKRCLNREPNHRPSAATAAVTLRGGSEGTGSGVLVGGAEPTADIQELIKRRVPQIVLIAVVGGYGLLQGIDLIFDNDSLIFALALPFVACGVVAWFHGERGKQATNVLEGIRLGAVALSWIAISAVIVVR